MLNDFLTKTINWNKKNRVSLFLLCSLINLCMFWFLCSYGHPIFATNDDFRMRLIVSGRFTGTPISQVPFISPILSNVLSMLYSFNKNFEWYGIIFESFLLISIIVIEYIFLKKSKTVKHLLFNSFVLLMLSVILYEKQIIMLQFTTVSAYLGAASIACLFEAKNLYIKDNIIKKNYILLSLIFFSLSMIVRRLVCVMFIPIYCILVLFTIEKNIPMKIKKTFLVVLLLFLAIYGSLRSYHLFYNHSDDAYQEYLDFNVIRSKLFDYDTIADYAKNKELYEYYDISVSEYKAISGRSYTIIPEFDIEFANKMIAIKEEANKQESVVNELITSTYKTYGLLFGGEVRYSFLAVLLIFLYCVIFQEIDNRDINIILLTILYIFVFTIYFYIKGRMMPRIVEAFSITLTAIILCSYRDVEVNTSEYRKRIRYYVYTFLLIITAIANQYSLTEDPNAIRETILYKTEQLNTLRRYVQKNPDNFYFYNANDFIASTEYVFNHSNKIENMDSLGNWYFRSPAYFERNAIFGIKTPLDSINESKSVFYVELNKWHSPINEYVIDNGHYFREKEKIEKENYTIIIYKVLSY